MSGGAHLRNELQSCLQARFCFFPLGRAMLAVSPADLEERSRNLDAALEVNASCSVVYKAKKSIGLFFFLKCKITQILCIVSALWTGMFLDLDHLFPTLLPPHTRFNIH